MNRFELAEYLANLLDIDAYLDDLGVAHKWLNDEEARAMKQLEEAIDEASRTGGPAGRLSQAGAETQVGQSGRSGPIGQPRGTAPSSSDAVSGRRI